MSSIAGLVQPDEGEIWVGGQLLTGATVSDIRRLIAWVPQEFTLPYDTVKECVFAPFKLRQNRNNSGIWDWSRRYIQNILSRFPEGNVSEL